MKLSKTKIELAMARKALTVTNLSKRYGVSRARMHVILNSREVTAMCAGRMANALEVDVKEIIED
ncbi:helix-turn-helix domain-containing protein [Enterocloster bolteae]|uniref:helix-turn-helix domain-containing protein n=1 Tax=Enterocloster bolteae TaxID=208479 RepID=UPI000E43C5AB|nr:helix-turn-helix domain-containing protein [Enterocloster bolteae]RGK70348.1 XRE family transcriptional regulator [Enterocloster bolteae]